MMTPFVVELDTVLPLSQACVDFLHNSDIIIIYDPDTDEIFHDDQCLANLMFVSNSKETLTSLILQFWMDAYLVTFIKEVGHGTPSNATGN